MSNARFCIIPARAIGDQRLNRTDIMVLNCLGLFGDKHGWCFPSTAKIAETIQCHRTSVSKSISILVECGYVEVRARYRNDGGQTSNEYRILFDAPQSEPLPPIDVQEAIDTIDSPPMADSLHPPYGETTIPPMASDAYPPVAHTPYHNNVPTLTPHVNATDDEKARAVMRIKSADENAHAKAKEIYDWLNDLFQPAWPLIMAPVYAWLEWGADFDADIKPVAERHRRKKPDKPPRSLSWLDEDIARSIAQRNKAKPEVTQHESANNHPTTSNQKKRSLGGFGIKFKESVTVQH